jgi:mannan endo-1,6-alpha-mannosidase
MMVLSQILTVLALAVHTLAVKMDPTSKDSVCAAAKVIQQGMWNYYEGFHRGGTVGEFVPPYYWWNAGEAFGGLVDYYTWCDPTNKTLEGWIYDGMFHQAGENFNYVPSNQSFVEGNDDQGVWGLAILEAVERNFTNPPDHSWLSLAQAIYNTMNSRWDTDNCGGGLRWQIFSWNSGYDYKNTISNGCLFHISARLARYFSGDNNTLVKNYTDTAEKVWNWMIDVGFMQMDPNSELELYDGATIIPSNKSCDDVTKLKWSYNFGVFIAGAAYMYNFTQDDVWLDRVNELWGASKYFFINNIMTETTCAVHNNCNNDQRSFRCLFARCLSLTAIMAPSMYDEIMHYMETSAVAAAQSCSGGSDGVTCGLNWGVSGWDGVYGLGEQMSALETVMSLINHDVPAPYMAGKEGVNATSDPFAGLNGNNSTNKNLINVTGKDKAGAGVLTAVVFVVILAGSVWMIF